MNPDLNTPSITPLIERQVPSLLSEQTAFFTQESLRAIEIMPFSPLTAKGKLRQLEGTLVLGADFGGDKGTVRSFRVTDGSLMLVDDYASDIQGDGGAGYLQTIEEAAAYAEAHHIPFGISWGAPLDGTKPLYHPKAAVFLNELQQKYSGDIASISTSIISVINDGPAGTLSGAVRAYEQYNSDNVLFVINGGGIGGSVVSSGMLYAIEPGHIQSVVELNTYHQTEPCLVYGAEYVCLERLGANKVGIESQWQAQTGEYMRARDIEDQYKAGNMLAGDLYDHSAWVVAHIIAGVAQAFDFELSSPNVCVVAHGGAFKFPYYGERIQQMLATGVGAPQFIMAKDYIQDGSNACLDGAAIAAAYSA